MKTEQFKLKTTDKIGIKCNECNNYTAVPMDWNIPLFEKQELKPGQCPYCKLLKDC